MEQEITGWRVKRTATSNISGSRSLIQTAHKHRAQYGGKACRPTRCALLHLPIMRNSDGQGSSPCRHETYCRISVPKTLPCPDTIQYPCLEEHKVRHKRCQAGQGLATRSPNSQQQSVPHRLPLSRVSRGSQSNVSKR